jgi:exodeoxyribonuclease V beta subunit
MAMGASIYYRPQVLKQITSGSHAVIEASAGTGKTFAIENLVLDLLRSGECTVDQILVVTFTEKATAELRVRIRQALEKILFGVQEAQPPPDTEPVPIDEGARKRLEDAFYSFDGAAISTIHGFCHRVLTDFAFQSGTPLQPELTDARGAFHRAFRAELRDHLAVNPATRALLERWLTGWSPDQPKGKTADELESLLYEACRRRYQESSDFGQRIKCAEHLIGSFNGQLLRDDCVRSNPKREALGNLRVLIEDLERCIEQARGSGQKLLDLFEGVKFNALFNQKSELARGLRFSKRCDGLLFDLRAVSIAAAAYEWKLVDLFLPAVRQRVERDKREHGLIDYEDMLAWVARALDGPGGEALAAVLRDRFRCALVDEFQDTDDLQWRIFRKLFVEGGRNRLYVVGDPKQAIYAFRGADVFTYLKARRELTPGNQRPIQLLDNFRSTSNLIDACNHIFDDKASARMLREAEIRLERPVRCGRPDREASTANAAAIVPVVLMRYQRADGEKAAVPELRRAIGRHLAQQLGLILNQDKERIRIEEKGGAARLVTAKDIFVLTRTRQESAEVGGYLREAGIPYAFYKQEGLFQTSEAGYVLDVLRAVAEPHIRSYRLKAWLSPFFNIPMRELALIDEVVPAHPLSERLYQWKGVAERGQLAELFDRLLYDSGLTARELLLTGSERQLTNYQHIFELLLAAAIARRLALPEIIALLEDYIFERASPGVEDANIQRLENERDAVSVITVHMSKGLEADVVALFGGFGRIPDFRKLVVYHDESGNLRFAIGKAAMDAARERFRTEEGDEDRRLLYVALTRARARLYLPLLPEGGIKKLGGYYCALNERLRDIEGELSHRKMSRLFAVQRVAEPFETAAGGAELTRAVAAWTPPPALTDESKDAAFEGSLWNLRRTHAPLVMRSYTSLRGAEEDQRWDIPAEEFKRDLEMPTDERDLLGGREVGIFLHETIEKVAMESFIQSPGLAAWRARDDTRRLFYAAMHRNQVKNAAWFERGTQAVFNALTVLIMIADGRSVGPLHRCRGVREMEFVYPIPETHHPLLHAAQASRKWTAARGYLKGFVDFVFGHEGLIYFADWKSDQLPSYDAAAIEEHVKNHYRIQAQIYSIGVVRLLRIRNEEDYKRFGGMLYVFLRGLDASGRRGVYFQRPSWGEICAREADLMRMQDGYTPHE